MYTMRHINIFIVKNPWKIFMAYLDETRLPDKLALLSTISKEQLLDKLGEDVFQSVVIDVLSGKNVRQFTEILTRSRLIQSNLSLLQYFLSEFILGVSPKNIFDNAKNSLMDGEFKRQNRATLEWLVAMTNKQTQNVLRDKHSEVFDQLLSATHEAISDISDGFPSIQEKIKIGDRQLTYQDLSYILLAIGSQTLTIRGSEKSLHGKYFEKLILGSVFQMLGFRFDESRSLEPKTFWLSSQEAGKRESDATLINNSLGIRIDIGFIGRGNTEITLDKVSRYRRQDEINGVPHAMSTIVIVDSIGEKSRTHQLANEIDGIVITMSDPLWVKHLSENVSRMLGVEDIFSGVDTQSDVHALIERLIPSVNMNQFIRL